MKKVLIPAVIIGGAIGVGVVLYGASQGWFSSKPENGDKKVVEPPPRKNDPKTREKPEEVITTQGLERLALILPDLHLGLREQRAYRRYAPQRCA